MVKLDLYISKEAPNVKNAAWLKPVNDGFELYALFNGKWKPVKMSDDSVGDSADDVVQELVGSVKDKKTANTINGAKAYADAIVGTKKDSSSNMTLYGLKAYIDEQIEGLG